MMDIIGRKQEKKELERLVASGRPEFVVVYGRRRVGKTYLVREFFKGTFSFYHTGLSPVEMGGERLMEQQLLVFNSSLTRYGYNKDYYPSNWMEAFDALADLLEERDSRERQVIFIDEMPWMDTPKSGFITALEHFWNGWASGHEQILLIVCGSATSWISDKLVNNHGGLYGRVTYEIQLSPFTLAECEAFYKANSIVFGRYDQLTSYMVFGGVPYYLAMLQRGMSLAQNIDRLFFHRNAPLRKEFDRLFLSLFANSSECMKIVRLLATKDIGFTRKEIAEKTKLPYGGGLSASLEALEASGFIVRYLPFKRSSRHQRYRLADMFCKFFIHFMEMEKISDEHYWSNSQRRPQNNAWSGFAFERLCYSHTPQIKEALGISGVLTEISPWISKQQKGGAQIDMLISRADNVLNICEMKFSHKEFAITAGYEGELRKKIDILEEEETPTQSLHPVIITTYGLRQNEYSGLIQNVITMNDLFRGPIE